MASTQHVGEVVHWVKIDMHHIATGQRETLWWCDLPWHVRSKWNWYFQYRYGLAIVQHPRWLVNFHWGNGPATGAYLAAHRRNVVRAKKAKITEYTNKMAKWRVEWRSLFPIENEEFWQKALAKIERTRQELAEAELAAQEVLSG